MNLVILGPQGSGKGTQAAFLAERHNLEHIDVGSALREVAKKKTPLGEKVNDIINIKKELVTDNLIREVLEEKIKDIPSEKGIIIDGAPRRVGQMDDVENIFSKFSRQIDKVIFVDISETESVDRISKRYSCAKCREKYVLGENLENPEKPCLKCGGKIKQREDDTPDGIKKRLAIFHEETFPVIEEYKKRGILLDINGEQPRDRVFEEIENNLNMK